MVVRPSLPQSLPGLDPGANGLREHGLFI